MSQFLKSAWKWLDGKKRNLALMYWMVIVPSITIVWPDEIPEIVDKLSTVTGLLFTAVGFSHAGIKKAVSK